jgi:uncharacterized protein
MTLPIHIKPVLAWQRMLSGRRLDLLEPSPDDIEIEDIAHGLARVARWNGQTTGAHAFSVAQHSILVADIFEMDHRLNDNHANDTAVLAALLHDAPEYVIGDLISPFKAAIGLDYKAFELRLLAAIHTRYGIPAVLPTVVTAAIKDADRIAAYYEATRLAGFSIDEAQIYFGNVEVNDQLAKRLESLVPWTAAKAQTQFVARFNALTISPN